MWEQVNQVIRDAIGGEFSPVNRKSLSANATGETFRIDTKSESIFLKRVNSSKSYLLDAEIDGLNAISRTNTLLTPRIIANSIESGFAWLALEFIELKEPDVKCFQSLGENLAAMHQVNNQNYGWHKNNWIGVNEQKNTYWPDWINFYVKFRLYPQLELALEKKLNSNTFDSGMLLLEECPKLFTSYKPKSSLLHGDLWKGNCGSDEFGRPVVFDPSCYYGDREVDLAMTELFGGFPKDFYSAYNSVAALDKGYSQRKTLYKLYHVLNHFNIFGSMYEDQADSMIRKILSDVR